MGYLEIASAGIIWAATGPLVRKLGEAGFSALDIVLGRAVFAVLFMGAWLSFQGWRRRSARKAGPDSNSDDEVVGHGTEGLLVPEPRDIPVFLALGFLAVVLSQTTYFYALSKTSVAVAVTLNYTAPFFVMVISRFLYREPLTPLKSAALAGAIVGVGLTSGFLGPGSGRLNMSVPGVLAGLLSGLAYGSQTIVYKRVGTKYGPVPLNFWTMALGAADLSILLTLITGGPPLVFARVAAAPTHVWGLFLLIGIGPGTAAFLLFADGINKVEATSGSIVAMCEPAAACLLSYFILGEKLTALQVAGVFMVLAGIWAVSVADAVRRKARRSLTT